MVSRCKWRFLINEEATSTTRISDGLTFSEKKKTADQDASSSLPYSTFSSFHDRSMNNPGSGGVLHLYALNLSALLRFVIR